jgi:hypothetical protein
VANMVAARFRVKLRTRPVSQSNVNEAVKSLEKTRRTVKIGIPLHS